MPRRDNVLEARIPAGNFILGLLGLLLGYEYFYARYFARFPDYRLTYLLMGVTVVYFLALRYTGYRSKRGMAGVASATLTSLDLMSAIGYMGLAVELGNYPVAYLLDVDPSVYALTTSSSTLLTLTALFVFFVVPRAAIQYFLPPIPKPVVVAAPSTALRVNTLEEILVALERRATQFRQEAGPEGAVVDPRNLQTLARLSRVVDSLRLLWQGIGAEGIGLKELPQVVSRRDAFRMRRGPGADRIFIMTPEHAARPEREALTRVLIDNPWALVLSRRVTGESVLEFNLQDG